MANQSTLRTLYSLTTARVPRATGFVEITLSGVAKTYIPSDALENCPLAQIAVTTANAAWYFSHWYPATAAQVQAQDFGICILVGPPEGEEQLRPCGSIAYMPALLELIANRETPSFVYEKTTERLSSSATEHAEGSKCSICMEFPAMYRWKECFHATDGPALVCCRCRNFILDNIADARTRRRKYDVQAACIICRKASTLVRHSR